MKFVKVTVEAKLSVYSLKVIRLQAMLSTMDVPILRVADADEYDCQCWLLKNISILNSDHPSLGSSIILLKDLIENHNDESLEGVK